jgi:hypothetical protein
MAGRNGPEWVAGINRNQWPECVGIRNLTLTLSCNESVKMGLLNYLEAFKEAA